VYIKDSGVVEPSLGIGSGGWTTPKWFGLKPAGVAGPPLNQTGGVTMSFGSGRVTPKQHLWVIQPPNTWE
jgi:hypothetical protein